MSTTPRSPNGRNGTSPLLPPLPSLTYSELNLSDLAVHRELFDPQENQTDLPPVQTLLPMVVHRHREGIFEVLDGCRRLLTLRNSGRKSCVCAVCDTDSDDVTAGLLRIMLNSSRPRNLRENVRILRWIRRNLAAEKHDPTAAALGINDSGLAEARLIIDCPEYVVNAVAAGHIHPAAAHDFSLLDESGQRTFLAVFSGLKLSRQTQKEFFRWLPAVATSTQQSVAELLTSPPLQVVLADTKIPAPHRIDNIRRALRELRFPRLSQSRDTWRKIAAHCNPDVRNVTFIPDPSFEKDRLEIRTIVRSAAEAQMLFTSLSSIEPETWHNLLRPWHGNSGNDRK